MKPSKAKIELWNRLVQEVFNHPKSEYSLFVYELIRRRVLGTAKKQFRQMEYIFGIKDIKGYFFDKVAMCSKCKRKGSLYNPLFVIECDEDRVSGCCQAKVVLVDKNG